MLDSALIFDPAKLPLTPAVLAVAKRVVWFMTPRKAIEDQELFLAHLMIYGDLTDVTIIRRHLSLEDFGRALDNAPPGVFDRRSWVYWRLITGRDPDAPLPVRRIPGVELGPDPFPFPGKS